MLSGPPNPGIRHRRPMLLAAGVLVAAAFLLGTLAVGQAGAATKAATDAAANELTIPKAIVLGVVEGITEYLPISSTGHLTVAERILNVGQTKATSDAMKSYTVIIQIGAILAVIGLYWRRLVDMFEGLIGRSVTGRRTLLTLVLAFLPAAVFGLLLDGPIQDHLFGTGPVAAAWIVGGIAILVFVRAFTRPPDEGLRMEDIGARHALIIGLAQTLALWPGVSRSLVTIVAALLVGMTLPAAVEFSFLLGLATLSAATGYEILKNGSTVVNTFGWVSPIVGVVAALISAVIAIKWLVGYLQHHDLSIFGYYRIVVGILVIVLLATHAI